MDVAAVSPVVDDTNLVRSTLQFMEFIWIYACEPVMSV